MLDTPIDIIGVILLLIGVMHLTDKFRTWLFIVTKYAVKCDKCAGNGIHLREKE